MFPSSWARTRVHRKGADRRSEQRSSTRAGRSRRRLRATIWMRSGPRFWRRHRQRGVGAHSRARKKTTTRFSIVSSVMLETGLFRLLRILRLGRRVAVFRRHSPPRTSHHHRRPFPRSSRSHRRRRRYERLRPAATSLPSPATKRRLSMTWSRRSPSLRSHRPRRLPGRLCSQGPLPRRSQLRRRNRAAAFRFG
jgi:hypothetical protein